MLTKVYESDILVNVKDKTPFSRVHCLNFGLTKNEIKLKLSLIRFLPVQDQLSAQNVRLVMRQHSMSTTILPTKHLNKNRS